MDIPVGLRAGGTELWVAISADHELNASQRVQLIEACRAKDRLDQFDALLRGDIDTWCHLRDTDYNPQEAVLIVNQAIDKANVTANLMKQLLAALRLPDDVTGRVPARRPGARGAYTPSGGGPVSSLERARAAKSS